MAVGKSESHSVSSPGTLLCFTASLAIGTLGSSVTTMPTPRMCIFSTATGATTKLCVVVPVDATKKTLRVVTGKPRVFVIARLENTIDVDAVEESNVAASLPRTFSIPLVGDVLVSEGATASQDRKESISSLFLNGMLFGRLLCVLLEELNTERRDTMVRAGREGGSVGKGG